MSNVRPAAVAGRFYPGSAGPLRETIESMVDSIDVPETDELARAYVVPHAGYRFSGTVAAHVYARLRKHADRITKIVLIGPSHFVPLEGFAGSPAVGWETPLGTVATPGVEGIGTDAAPHEREHCLEVQLPFLQVCVGEVEVTPIAVGKSTIKDSATSINEIVDEHTVLLCSTDLSHYHDEDTAKRLDRATADAILAAEPRRINTSDACGVFALRGTVAWAAHHGLSARELSVSTSADTTGTTDRVVGYPAFSFSRTRNLVPWSRVNSHVIKESSRERGNRRCRRQSCPRKCGVNNRTNSPRRKRRNCRRINTSCCGTWPADCPIRPLDAEWACRAARCNAALDPLWTTLAYKPVSSWECGPQDVVMIS